MEQKCSRSVKRVEITNAVGVACEEYRRRVSDMPDGIVKFNEVLHLFAFLQAEIDQQMDALIVLGYRMGGAMALRLLVTHAEMTVYAFERAKIMLADVGMDIDIVVEKDSLRRYGSIPKTIAMLKEMLREAENGTFKPRVEIRGVGLTQAKGSPEAIAAELDRQMGIENKPEVN